MPRQAWTEEDDEMLRRLYHSEGPTRLLKRMPHRTYASIQCRAQRMGLHYFDEWSVQEDEVLKQCCSAGGGYKQAAQLIDRTESCTKSRARLLGLRYCGDYKARMIDHPRSYRGHEDISLTRWNAIRASAAKRHLDFTITIERGWQLFEAQQRKCALSGMPITFPTEARSNDGTASLDRIDSSKGYIEGNVQWVHVTANRMKWDLTQDDFISFCHLVANLHLKP